MIIRVIDVESTGIPSETEAHALVEVARTDLWLSASGEIEIIGPAAMLVNPGRPIPPEASAVHHITDKDVAGAPPPDVGCAFLNEGTVDIFCAQNADFDRQFFGGGGRPWICSWKSSLRIWPDAPGHSNRSCATGSASTTRWSTTLPCRRTAPARTATSPRTS
jgi:exodeoxyribonuclease X